MTRSILALIAAFAVTSAAAATDGQLAQNHVISQTAQALQATPSQAIRHAQRNRAGSPLALSVARTQVSGLAANTRASLPTLGMSERHARATAVTGNTMSAPDGAAVDANRPAITE